MSTEIPGLSAARNVHFILSSGPNAGKHRPAIISEVQNEKTGIVKMTIFNTREDGFTGPVQLREDVPFDPQGKQLGSWHFPEQK